MAVVFDGRAFAAEKILRLDREIAKLKNRGIHPKLASILVGRDPASLLYVSLKKKRAEAIGAEMDVYYLKENELLEKVLALIDSLNSDPTVSGIMVQLPLPKPILNCKLQILNAIDPKKDVDGLRDDSPFVHPTAMAVLQIISEAKKLVPSAYCLKAICVVGEGGMVGKALIKEIKKSKLQLIEETEKAEIIVSATGQSGLITAGKVKEGVILIDVGSPVGDIDPSAHAKAGFYTPVPGGVGPVTIACLLENLIIASGRQLC